MDIAINDIQIKREKTELVLSNVYNLPAIPAIMMEISRLLEKPNATANELAKIIGRDQAIASKILSIANSPLYGLPRKVSTIDFAVLIIGFDDIRNIVTALSMVESFKNKTDKNLNQKQFWLHSLLTGLAAKKFANELGYKNGSEAFVAGLIHELGIPVIHKYFHTNFIVIVEKVKTAKISFMESEYDVLGLTHQEIGKFLAKKWNLPSSLCETIAHHHEPGKAEDNLTLAALIHLADYAVNKLEIADFYWDENYAFDEDVIRILGFENMESVDNFIDKYKNELIEEANSFRL